MRERLSRAKLAFTRRLRLYSQRAPSTRQMRKSSPHTDEIAAMIVVVCWSDVTAGSLLAAEPGEGEETDCEAPFELVLTGANELRELVGALVEFPA